MIKKYKINFCFLALAVFFGVVYFLNSGETAIAAVSDNLSGYAWSENIGWINFNNTNYGVNVAANGVMSGYAWSENIGWINFAGAYLDNITGKVTGTISVIAGAGRTDGWDGTIKLSGTATDGSPYGVSVTGCDWNGYAWGSDVVGWIHFSGSTYGVKGTGNACVTVSASHTVTASINSGIGTITGPGINCPGDCSETYPSGTWITLIATPAPGYAFNNWIPSVGTICGGQGNTCSALIDDDKTARVNFNSVPPSAVEVTLSASPNPVAYNTASTLTWTSSNATSCTASNDWNGSRVLNGSQSTGNLISVRTYTLTCFGPGGSASRTVTVNVNPSNPMSVTCVPTPSTALIGQTVTWTANIVSGGTPPFTYTWSGSSPISTTPVGPTSATTNSQSVVYSTIGQKTATVKVTDDVSVEATCPINTVQINFDPTLEEF